MKLIITDMPNKNTLLMIFKLEIPEEYTQNTLSSSTWGSEDVMRESYSVFKTLCTLEITENYNLL